MEVSNILLLSQLGVVTGDILADIILGKANPSGKLAATWATFKDYKFINEFGNLDDTNYLEGVMLDIDILIVKVLSLYFLLDLENPILHLKLKKFH